MAWNLKQQLRIVPRWTDIPLTPTTGTIRTGAGTARACIEPGQRAVLQLVDVALTDGTGAGILFTPAELATVGPLPVGAAGLVGHLVGSSSTSTLKAAGALYWISANNGLSAPSLTRSGISLRGEMTWHIG